MGHCWRSKDELISDVLQWTPSYERASVGWPARTYLQQLCTDIGCSLEDLLEVMDDREECRERAKEIHASGTSWWWWWWCHPQTVCSVISQLFSVTKHVRHFKPGSKPVCSSYWKGSFWVALDNDQPIYLYSLV